MVLLMQQRHFFFLRAEKKKENNPGTKTSITQECIHIFQASFHVFHDSPPCSGNVPCLNPSCDIFKSCLNKFPGDFITATSQPLTRITSNLISNAIHGKNAI